MPKMYLKMPQLVQKLVKQYKKQFTWYCQKFLKNFENCTNQWRKGVIFGYFREKTWFLLRFVFFGNFPFLRQLLKMGSQNSVCSFPIHLSKNVVQDFFQFSFFGRFWGRKHGSRCKLVQISWFSANYDQKNKNCQKSCITFFSTTPGNLHTKFQPHTICGC